MLKLIEFSDTYNGWNATNCRYYEDQDRGTYYMTIQKQVNTFHFDLRLSNKFYSKHFYNYVTLDIVRKQDILNNDNIYTTKYPDILINITDCKQLEQAVKIDCKSVKIDKLKSILDTVDLTIELFLKLYDTKINIMR